MPRKATAKSLTIPPPVSGWNTKDPLSQMDQTYAVEMENYFPNFSTVDLVKGYRYHSKSIGTGAVYGLASFETAGTAYLLASGTAAGPSYKVYNATTASAAATDITGAATLSGPVLFTQQFNGYMFLSTGQTDVLFVWTGAGNIATTSLTTGGSPLSSIGPMTVYKSRLYLGLLSSPLVPRYTSVYYGGVDAISGATSTFDFGSVIRNGGGILFIGSVTRAKDFSEDELFCVIFNTGEILVYEGDYPGSLTWRIIGHYFIPRPLGAKAFFYIGANLCIMTSQGVVTMADIMGGTATGKYNALTQNITPSFTEAATTSLLYDAAWCGVNYPRGNFAICNIPTSAGATANQFYMNTTTGAWCKRTNQNAFSWCIHQDELYFGGLSGRLFKADNGYFDEDPASEGAVLSRSTKLRPAYNYLDDRSSTKQFTTANIILKESEGLTLTVDADVDYADRTPTSTLTNTTDTSYKRYHAKAGLTGIGKAASIRFEDTVTTKRRSIEAIEVHWNEGDIV